MLDFKCWPWMWKWKHSRLWKCPIVWPNNAYLFILLLGVVCGGVGVEGFEMSEELTLETEEEVKSQLTFAVHWKCSCMAALTIPTAVKYRPWDPWWCGGLGLPPRWLFFVVPFWWERASKSDWITALQGSPQISKHAIFKRYQVYGGQRHFWSTCVGRLYVWSKLCSGYIRSIFRYRVNPPSKHIKRIPNCHYLTWELTSPF